MKGDRWIFNVRNRLKHLEPGRPARYGQLILERRIEIFKSIVARRDDRGCLLDLGCGNGAQTELLASVARWVVGLDYAAPERMEGASERPVFRRVRGDALAVPFRAESFDIVTAFEVFEHLPDDRRAVREVVRVLKPGGWFVMTVPNRWWLFETHGAVVRGLNWVPWNRVPLLSWLPTALHDRIARARIYTMRQASKLVEENGLIIERTGYITAPLDVLPEGRLRRWLRRRIFGHNVTGNPLLAVNLFVAARKP